MLTYRNDLSSGLQLCIDMNVSGSFKHYATILETASIAW